MPSQLEQIILPGKLGGFGKYEQLLEKKTKLGLNYNCSIFLYPIDCVLE